ncbi:MAG: sigma-54-dependent Fis family transcriptional regulator [Verrucomicrobia bacterium]|nr:sigma-54-dependent Fis family transcriptional regulator [Verrucomicrobiota bacterium]
MKPAILIVDDEKPSRQGLRAALEERYDVYLAEDARSAAELLSAEPFDVLLSDLRMPGEDGLKLIQRAKALPHPPVCILMTAYGSEELAVEAMKHGADDYISKGRLQLDELEIRISRLLKSRVLEAENVQLQKQLDDRYGLHAILGESPAIRAVLDVVKQAAPSRATVLLEGESGTGKELVARAVHSLSPRVKERFIAVHCAALSPTLLESELFGHEKGAFTGAFERRQGRFEMADGGSLFLDEIGEIDATLQVKILRVLETREFERVGGDKSIQSDIRLIAATNRDLKKMVADGKFREDLFFRLNVIAVKLPALRERREDIPILANHFLKEFCRENGKRIQGFPPDVMQLFLRHSWPGNIRELRNVVNRMVVMSRGERLAARDAPPELREAQASPAFASDGGEGNLNLAAMERRLIVKALKQTGGNISRAAPLLGVSRRTLHRKLKEMNLRP